MANLEAVWKEALNHPPDGCVRCGKVSLDDGSKVQWTCAGCGYLVCRECTLCKPGWRRPTEPHGRSGWDHEPSPGGLEFLWQTLCSKTCWERVGRPDE